jgi:hypothetical protein
LAGGLSLFRDPNTQQARVPVPFVPTNWATHG